MDKDNNNNLLSACYYGNNLKALKYIDTYKQYNCDYFGNSILFYACRNNMIDVVEELIRKMPKDYIDKQNIFLETPLHEAVKYDHIDIVKLLLSKGADPNIPDLDGNIPLSYSLITKSFKSSLVLIPVSQINLTNKLGLSAFYYACFLQQDMIASSLLNYGYYLEEDKNLYLDIVFNDNHGYFLSSSLFSLL